MHVCVEASEDEFGGDSGGVGPGVEFVEEARRNVFTEWVRMEVRLKSRPAAPRGWEGRAKGSWEDNFLGVEGVRIADFGTGVWRL